MVKQIGDVIESLTIDVSAFKKRFNKLSSMSSYERANTLALERKRAAWAAYRPLAREQLYDNIDDGVVLTIVTPLASRAPKRSTRNGALHAQTTVIHRPTEILAILHSLGLFLFSEEDVVVRQDPNKILHWCVACQTFKSPDSFPVVKYSIDGLAFACKTCRNKEDRYVWKRGAA